MRAAVGRGDAAAALDVGLDPRAARGAGRRRARLGHGRPREAEGREAGVRVTVALVVAVRETQAGTIYVVSAPELPHVHVAARERDEARSKAQKAIKEAFEHWDLDAVLSCDDVGRVAAGARRGAVPAAVGGRGRPTTGSRSRRPPTTSPRWPRPAASRASTAATPSSSACSRRSAPRRAPASCSSGAQDVGKTALVDEVASRLAAGDVPAPLAGQAALAHLGERADRRRALHGHVAGPGARPDRARPRGRDLRDGRPERDHRRGPLERQRQQPRPRAPDLRRERRAEPHLRVHARSSTPPRTSSSRASSTRSSGSTCPSRPRTRRARSSTLAAAAARGEARARGRAARRAPRRSTSAGASSRTGRCPARPCGCSRRRSSRSRRPSRRRRASAART